MITKQYPYYPFYLVIFRNEFTNHWKYRHTGLMGGGGNHVHLGQLHRPSCFRQHFTFHFFGDGLFSLFLRSSVMVSVSPAIIYFLCSRCIWGAPLFHHSPVFCSFRYQVCHCCPIATCVTVCLVSSSYSILSISWHCCLDVFLECSLLPGSER